MSAQIFAFLTLVATLIFLMGLVTNPKGTAAILDSLGSNLTRIFTLELGVVPRSK